MKHAASKHTASKHTAPKHTAPKHTARRTLLPVCALAALTACWSQQAGIQTVSAPPERKPVVDSRPSNAGPDLTVDLSGPQAQGYVPLGYEMRVLPGGLTLIARTNVGDRPTAPARPALLRCTLPIGRLQAKPGQIEVTAAMLLWAAEKGLPSLERAIAELGGVTFLEIGSSDTTIDILVPTERWAQALERVAQAMLRPPSAEAQLDSVRHRFLREWRGRFLSDPLTSLVPRIIDAAQATSSEWLAGAQETTLEEVRKQWRILCRPAGAVIAIDATLPSTVTAFTEAAAALTPWTAAMVDAEPVPRATRRTGSGEFLWAERPATFPRVAIVLERKEIGSAYALEVMLLQACLTQGGIGGRLGRELERIAGTAPMLAEQVVRDGSRRFSLLTTSATAEQAALLQNALGRAVETLTTRLPEDDELTTALARTKLQLLEDESDPRAWLSSAVSLAHPVKATANSAPTNLANELRRLQSQQSLDLRGALPEFRASVLATVVFGGAVPEGSSANKLVGATPSNRADPSFAPDEIGKEQAARPFLDGAVRALGGRDALKLLGGFASTSVVRGDNGATLEETSFWRDDGRLRRLRRVLGTSIEAVIAAGKGTESSGEQSLDLSSDDVRSLLNRGERHPVTLLASWLRGKLRFKLVSLRTIDEREMAILELIDPTRERLRMQIDIASGLVRQAETREHWPGVGRVQIVESYSDYRSLRGVRTPFHVVTNVDTGGMTVTTDFKTFVPRTPTDAELTRGGPDRPEDDR